ncbi:family 1 glycosylhydrolase, partial [Enterococcus faecalis]|nr:family 1 glycosylhydrolase [Enterococcus faecalis]
NEINMIIHAPYMAAGLVFKDDDFVELIKYQAAHHELIASALATKLEKEVNPKNKVGCMFAAGSVYPYSCNSKDVWEALKIEQENYLFVVIQVRGRYPPYAIKEFERKNIEIKMKKTTKIF